MVKAMVRALRECNPREPSPQKVLRLLNAEIVAARQRHRTVCDQNAAARNRADARSLHLRDDLIGEA
jgi:hypothetical protein